MEMRKILDEEKPGMTFAEMNALIALKWKVGAGFFLNELISSLYVIMDKNVNLPFLLDDCRKPLTSKYGMTRHLKLKRSILLRWRSTTKLRL